MKPRDSKDHLTRQILAEGLDIEALKPSEAVHMMLPFYKSVRVEGADPEEDHDMLLYRWGMYDRGRGHSFEFDIVRHFIESGTEDDDGMTQLCLTCRFRPTAELEALGAGEQWCRRPEGIVDFKNVIFNSAPYRAVAHVSPASAALDFNPV